MVTKMIEFTLPIKPFSVNAYRCRDQRFKTAEAQDWETKLKWLLEDYAKEFNELREDFEKYGGFFHVTIMVFYPMHVFYNKSEAVSAKTIDITNFEKPLVDMIFRETMGVDDRFITRLSSSKQAGGTQNISVRIVHQSEHPDFHP